MDLQVNGKALSRLEILSIHITYKINFTPRLTTALINIKGIDTIKEIFIYTLANHSSLHNIY